jgi:predicted dehydrogenase
MGPREDLAFAIGSLDNGAALSMEAGWLSPAKVREVRVVGENGTFLADTLLQEIHLQENSIGEDEWEALATFRGIGEGNVTRFAIRREEPLRSELRNFLARVRGEDGEIVSLEDGMAAVRLAIAVRESVAI